MKKLATDAHYLAAVKQGDTKAAQQMVDAEAEWDGYVKMHHGSTREYGVSSTELGVHFGDEDAANERLMQTGQTSGTADTYWVKIENPVRLKWDPDQWEPYEVWQSLPKDVRAKIESSFDNSIREITREELKLALQEEGFDGIKYINTYEGGESFVAFEEDQWFPIDDPKFHSVTYDKSGNVIPLSKRFNNIWRSEEITNPAGRIPAQFPYEYASYLKQHFPEIWKLGGNTRGNDAFRWWSAYRQGDRSPTVTHWWTVTRPAWIARHYRDHVIAGVVAQIKWGTIGSLGVAGMKRVVETKIRNTR